MEGMHIMHSTNRLAWKRSGHCESEPNDICHLRVLRWRLLSVGPSPWHGSASTSYFLSRRRVCNVAPALHSSISVWSCVSSGV